MRDDVICMPMFVYFYLSVTERQLNPVAFITGEAYAYGQLAQSI